MSETNLAELIGAWQPVKQTLTKMKQNWSTSLYLAPALHRVIVGNTGISNVIVRIMNPRGTKKLNVRKVEQQ